MRGILYIPAEIAILVPPDDQLIYNLQKRAQERGYSEEKLEEVRGRQFLENNMIDKVLSMYKNSYVFSSLKEFSDKLY